MNRLNPFKHIRHNNYKFLFEVTWKYGKWLVIPAMWIKLSFMDRIRVKQYMFSKGLSLSQKCKYLHIWDYMVEPLFVRQCDMAFVAMYSFIKGMTSDNPNKDQIKQEFDQLHENIKQELEDKSEDVPQNGTEQCK